MFGRIVAGFIAGCLAVLIFHQGMYVILQQLGWPLRGTVFNTTPDPLWVELFRGLKMSAPSLPRIVNQAIWGGLWGILFAYLIDRMPGGITLIKGLVFGLIFPMLLGSWIIIPLVKGTALFAGAFAKGGFDLMALRTGFMLNGVAFGLGLGLLYPWIRRRLQS